MNTIGWVSPFPPNTSGIATFSSEYLPYLRKLAHVVPLASNPRAHDSYGTAVTWVASGRGQRLLKGLSAVVYSLGNSLPDHLHTLLALQRVPGYVYLHDVSIHQMLGGYYFEYLRQPEQYFLLLENIFGKRAAWAVEGWYNKRYQPLWEMSPDVIPLCEYLFPFAKGMIVHSEYAAQILKAAGYKGGVLVVNHPIFVSLADSPNKKTISDHYMLVSPGFVNRNKRPDLVVGLADQITRLTNRAVNVLFLGRQNVAVPESRVGNLVTVSGYVPRDTYLEALSQADFVAVLRQPTLGEASGVALEALSLGKPVVVNDVGWYAEQTHPLFVKWTTSLDISDAAKGLLARRESCDESTSVGCYDPDVLAARILTFVS